MQGIGTPGQNNPVVAMANLLGGDVIIGGGFSRAGGVSVRNIARFTFVVPAAALNAEAPR